MSGIGDVQEFVRQCNLATETGELHRLLDDITRALGFQYFAMAHHVDLVGLPVDAIFLKTYPDSWVEQSLSRRYYVDDPIHVASTRTAIGFLWSDVPSMIRLTSRQASILEAARQQGLGDGFTIPVHVPGEYRGTCSFSTPDFSALLPEALPAAQLAGSFAFEAARRILRRHNLVTTTSEIPELSQRQLDCLTFVARGKTDWEIAQILGISQPTVRQHIETASRRYGVFKRTHLVVRALFDGHIAFSDILH